MCLFHIDSIFTKIKIIYWLASKIVSQIIAQLQALFSITSKLFPPSFHQVRLRVILLSSEFHTLACFHEMFIGTRTNVILKDELLPTFFYQLLWLFYPFYWSSLNVCSSCLVWRFTKLISSSVRSSCCFLRVLVRLDFFPVCLFAVF